MHLTRPVNPDRPKARQWSPQPGRLNTADRLRSTLTERRLRVVEDDWLWASVSATGRTRLLVEHGLLPRCALGTP
jgi:hypothetical protein